MIWGDHNSILCPVEECAVFDEEVARFRTIRKAQERLQGLRASLSANAQSSAWELLLPNPKRRRRYGSTSLTTGRFAGALHSVTVTSSWRAADGVCAELTRR